MIWIKVIVLLIGLIGLVLVNRFLIQLGIGIWYWAENQRSLYKDWRK